VLRKVAMRAYDWHYINSWNQVGVLYLKHAPC